MSPKAVPIVVLTDNEDNVEAINRILREAGHPAHCRWIPRLKSLPEALQEHTELVYLFQDDYPDALAGVADVRDNTAAKVPLLVVRTVVDEKAISSAM